ncbi:hypothetical protein RND71_017346 [Anisodus tanguticus]|uniref:Uncharacterized protein n=1 Tax=Anisodus tanguticus TaxID=243964 RepID=A0AAE1S272_9SOLA|nr:hypothetical protein RND71_017346 [Anisodus tanguticus]
MHPLSDGFTVDHTISVKLHGGVRFLVYLTRKLMEIQVILVWVLDFMSSYELGILFITPHPDAQGKTNQRANLDDLVLPFVVPPPKYRPADKPATPQEMREALFEQTELRRDVFEAAKEADEWVQEEIPEEEEEVIEATGFVVKEKEDEKAYAEKLWSQVDSSENC